MDDFPLRAKSSPCTSYSLQCKALPRTARADTAGNDFTSSNEAARLPNPSHPACLQPLQNGTVILASDDLRCKRGGTGGGGRGRSGGVNSVEKRHSSLLHCTFMAATIITWYGTMQLLAGNARVAAIGMPYPVRRTSLALWMGATWRSDRNYSRDDFLPSRSKTPDESCERSPISTAEALSFPLY